MKKCALLVLALVLMTTQQGVAADGNGPYVGMSFGVTLINDSNLSDTLGNYGSQSYDPGFLMNMVGGYDFGLLRLEGEFAYRVASITHVSVVPGVVQDYYGGWATRYDPNMNAGVLSGMFNAWFDFKNKSIVTPYAGGGIGFVNVDLLDSNDYYYSYDSATAFAYQVGGGIAIRVARNLDLDIGYRYLGSNDLDLGILTPGTYPPFKATFASNNISVGLRYTFR